MRAPGKRARSGWFPRVDARAGYGVDQWSGATSRAMRFEARKVIGPRPDVSDSAADVLAQPVVVCRASGTCVVPREKQRGQAGGATYG